MKKRFIVVITIVICVMGLLCTLLFVFNKSICMDNIEEIAGYSTFFYNMIVDEEKGETLLQTSVSPNGTYTIEAYRTEPGATVDYSIKVYLIGEDKKMLIYNAYHEFTVTIEWVSDEAVIINDRKLNIANGEKYDWQNN